MKLRYIEYSLNPKVIIIDNHACNISCKVASYAEFTENFSPSPIAIVNNDKWSILQATNSK